MGAESSPVGVKLVHHDVLQVGKEEVEAVAVVVGQKCGVEHLGISEDDVRASPDAPPLCGRGIPVVDSRLETGFPEELQKGPQCPELVARKRLCGVEEESPCRGRSKDLLHYGEQEAQGLAAGRGGGYDHVFPVQHPVEHLTLVGVEHGNTHTLQESAHLGHHPAREGSVHRIPLRDHLFVNYLFPELFHVDHGTPSPVRGICFSGINNGTSPPACQETRRKGSERPAFPPPDIIEDGACFQ
ncbi:hypothetical protein SDC9_125139 [bioreactor metagenome]|uniref:Uncharacterized protein n=1 Tax=bioreactor metagenome TaxID=1076179 RepID=A0A645CMI9_9ZZZZ